MLVALGVVAEETGAATHDEHTVGSGPIIEQLVNHQLVAQLVHAVEHKDEPPLAYSDSVLRLKTGKIAPKRGLGAALLDHLLHQKTRSVTVDGLPHRRGDKGQADDDGHAGGAAGRGREAAVLLHQAPAQERLAGARAALHKHAPTLSLAAAARGNVSGGAAEDGCQQRVQLEQLLFGLGVSDQAKAQRHVDIEPGTQVVALARQQVRVLAPQPPHELGYMLCTRAVNAIAVEQARFWSAPEGERVDEDRGARNVRALQVLDHLGAWAARCHVDVAVSEQRRQQIVVVGAEVGQQPAAEGSAQIGCNLWFAELLQEERKRVAPVKIPHLAHWKPIRAVLQSSIELLREGDESGIRIEDLGKHGHDRADIGLHG
eukprot:m.203624 g.203624  ORF g.203624 m.203624 type:complete len:373 (+) comp10114_c1_seq3:1116-2234(+)